MIEVEGNRLYDSEVIEKAVLNDDFSWNSLYVFVKYKFVDNEGSALCMIRWKSA